MTRDYIGPMKLEIKFAMPNTGKINVFASLKHINPTIEKCEVKRINERPNLIMIPTQEKVENHFTAECCYLALECKGIE